MSLELLGLAAAWLAHSAWYAGRSKRGNLLGIAGSRRVRALPGVAPLLLIVAVASWVGAHGAGLGACFAVVALTAAASFNALVAPYSPRAFFVTSALGGAVLLAGLAGWVHGA